MAFRALLVTVLFFLALSTAEGMRGDLLRLRRSPAAIREDFLRFGRSPFVAMSDPDDWTYGTRVNVRNFDGLPRAPFTPRQ